MPSEAREEFSKFIIEADRQLIDGYFTLGEWADAMASRILDRYTVTPKESK